MNFEESDIIDEIFWDINLIPNGNNPNSIDSVKEYFFKSPFYQTIGYNSEETEIMVEESKNSHFFVIYKKIKEKIIAVYFLIGFKIFKANSLKYVLENNFASLNAKIDKLNQKIFEYFDWNVWQKESKEKNTLKLKQEYF